MITPGTALALHSQISTTSIGALRAPAKTILAEISMDENA
jgi:hypothetical protein